MISNYIDLNNRNTLSFEKSFLAEVALRDLTKQIQPFDKRTYTPYTAIDTEFIAVPNGKTIPLCIGIGNPDYGKLMYLHPNAPIPLEDRIHPTFKTPIVFLDVLADVYGLEWRFRGEEIKKPKNSFNIKIVIFWSYKDIEFCFADEQMYRDYVLPKLDRKRRIRLKNSNGNSTISLPFDILVNGKFYYLTIEIIDISAMQGSGSLADYARNVGFNVDSKDEYTSTDKSRMDLRYMEDPYKVEKYLLGTDTDLVQIYDETNKMFTKIAKELLGLNKKSDYGLSLGKIDATMFTDYLAKQIKVEPKYIAVLNNLASTEGISSLARLLRNNDLLYLGMVDGGRCVKERDVDHVEDDLIDIDISGCYGNGLLNQKYPLGQPTLISEPIKLKNFLKEYEKQLISGLWTARVSYQEAPFSQDLLISKLEKKFMLWDMAVQDLEALERINTEIEDDQERVYAASMVLQTNELTHATLNHDLLQIIKSVASDKEWGWLSENMYIESAAIYCKDDLVDNVTTEMLQGVIHNETDNNFISRTKNFVVVNLMEPVKKLLSERKKYPKGTSMNTFLKLVINTLYGVIASSYFSGDKAGLSNYVVANNITARARGLAWLMAKGLNSYMSITDGGVFPINKVLRYKRKSLNLLSMIFNNKHTDKNLRRFVNEVPLMDEVFDCNKPVTKEELNKIDKQAYKHLKNEFKGIDILDNDQYDFESKGHFIQLTLHSKADYRLIDYAGNVKIAMRSMTKIDDPVTGEKVINPIANKIFDDIKNGVANKYVVNDKKFLSLKDWKKSSNTDQERLLPHDTLISEKIFYTLTNLGMRFKNQKLYKKFERLYKAAKESGLAEEVAGARKKLEKNYC